jgi:hypothetical protein
MAAGRNEKQEYKLTLPLREAFQAKTTQKVVKIRRPIARTAIPDKRRR